MFLYLFVNSQNSQISRFANELFDKKIDLKTNDEAYKDILYKNNIFYTIVMKLLKII